MRVIAGTARRCLLLSPTGLTTRPTADRAKEALFNILGTLITGARFLDLFGGSGAMGIEALSRGAQTAVFVDNSKPALAAIKHNLHAAKLDKQAEVLPLTADKAIPLLHQRDDVFDIVFLDPPYDEILLNKALQDLNTYPLAGENGVIIAETDNRLTVTAPAGMACTQQRDYGRTRFYFFRRVYDVIVPG